MSVGRKGATGADTERARVVPDLLLIVAHLAVVARHHLAKTFRYMETSGVGNTATTMSGSIHGAAPKRRGKLTRAA